MIPATPKVISDFNALFSLVWVKHTGPAKRAFGRQKIWDGIVASQCSPNILFIKTESINAFLDTKANKLIFSMGTPELLESILSQQLMKMRESRAAA